MSDKKRKWPEPERVKVEDPIKPKNPPGGPHTPGAKKDRKIRDRAGRTGERKHYK